MSVTVTTYNEKSYVIGDEVAEAIARGMAMGERFAHIKELSVTLALADIRSMDYTTPASEVPEYRRIEAPIHKPEPWKWEQLQALMGRLRRNLDLAANERGEWPGWIDNEPQFRRVMAGEEPWPQLTRKTKAISTTVIDENNHVVQVRTEGGIYSHSEMAARRAANRLKYAPGWQKERAKVLKNTAPDENPSI